MTSSFACTNNNANSARWRSPPSRSGSPLTPRLKRTEHPKLQQPHGVRSPWQAIIRARRRAPQPCDRTGKANVTDPSPRSSEAARRPDRTRRSTQQEASRMTRTNRLPSDRRGRRCGAHAGHDRRPGLGQDLRLQLKGLTRPAASPEHLSGGQCPVRRGGIEWSYVAIGSSAVALALIGVGWRSRSAAAAPTRTAHSQQRPADKRRAIAPDPSCSTDRTRPALDLQPSPAEKGGAHASDTGPYPANHSRDRS